MLMFMGKEFDREGFGYEGGYTIWTLRRPQIIIYTSLHSLKGLHPVKMPPARTKRDKVLCSCGCQTMLSQSQARNHINGRRSIGLQAALYEQSPWLERVRNTIWRGTKANATSSRNASTDEHHSRAAQSDAVSAPSYGSAATDQMVIPVTGATPTFTVDSNALQCLIQAPILANNASIPQGRRHNGMTMEDADLPAAGATPASPVGSFNALQHPPNPRNVFDAAESNHSRLLEDATSLFEEMVRHRWAGIRHNLETTMEDTEEDAHDGSSMDDEEECYSADENDMWNLTDSAAPREEISGISLEDKLGEHFMREAGNSPSYN